MITQQLPQPRPASANRQLVRDISDDYALLNALNRQGWQISDADYKNDLYWATRTCKRLKN